MPTRMRSEFNEQTLKELRSSSGNDGNRAVIYNEQSTEGEECR